MRSLSLFASLVLLGATCVLAQGGQSCNATSICSSATAPCCSEYGFCGKDHFCLGGCNPTHSKSLDSCNPAPVCQDKIYSFADNSRILSNSTDFDGNASAYDFVVDKGQIMNTNSSGGELAILLTKEKGGTRLSSTRYVHYGTITAKLKTARTKGVITAFITMSDVKDEVDWEFPGAGTTEGQSNFFWQGHIPEKTNGDKTNDLSDTFNNYHDFGIDWQQDQLSWLVDGKVVRSVKAADYSGQYPTTPSRIQFSVWGVDGMPQGTIEWAGGLIDYSDPDYVAQGHVAAMFQSITVKCADPTKPGANDTGYVYSTNDTIPVVALTGATTLLAGAAKSGSSTKPKWFWFAVIGGIVGILLLLAGFCAIRRRKKSRARGAYAKVADPFAHSGAPAQNMNMHSMPHVGYQ